jgi:protein ImuB
VQASLASAAPELDAPHAATRLAIALWGMDPRRGRLIVACCDLATSLGVRVGMTVSQADSLLQAASDTTVWIAQHDSQADWEALGNLAERCAECISPLVAIEPLENFLWAGQILHQPQALLLDVTGLGNWFGGESSLVAATQNVLEQAGYCGRIAIADTQGAAWGVAHCAQATAPNLSQPHRSNAAWIIPPGAQQHALEPLRIAALRVRSETAVMLRRLGVTSIGALMRLPRSGLVTRFGPDLLLRLDQALGAVTEILPMHQAAQEHRQSVELQYPTTDRDILAHQLSLLLKKLVTGLSQHQQGVLRLSCRLEQETPPPLELRLGLFTPTASHEHLERLLLGNLERCRLSSTVHRIVMTATLTGPLTTRQPTLLDIGDGESSSVYELAKLIDNLSGRLGRERVLVAESTHHPLPEQAIRVRPLTGQPMGAMIPGRPALKRALATRKSSRKNAPHTSSASTHSSTATNQFDTLNWRAAHSSDPLRRPTILYKKPLPLLVLESQTPTSNQAFNEPPARFRRGNQEHQIRRSWGPERLETGWWHGPMQRRDYFRVETSSGQWLWIYRDLRQGGWWLHGLFS